MRIEITTEHSASSYGQPVILVDGELVDSTEGLRAIYEALATLPPVPPTQTRQEKGDE